LDELSLVHIAFMNFSSRLSLGSGYLRVHVCNLVGDVVRHVFEAASGGKGREAGGVTEFSPKSKAPLEIAAIYQWINRRAGDGHGRGK
jgi:hypothetical protein